MSQAASAVSPTSISSWRIIPGMSRTTSRTLPVRPVIRSVTCTGIDRQMKCFMRRNRFLQTTYMSKYRCCEFCCRCFAVESGSSLMMHLSRSQTSVFRVFFGGMCDETKTELDAIRCQQATATFPIHSPGVTTSASPLEDANSIVRL